jgi:hypothetical protein
MDARKGWSEVGVEYRTSGSARPPSQKKYVPAFLRLIRFSRAKVTGTVSFQRLQGLGGWRCPGCLLQQQKQRASRTAVAIFGKHKSAGRPRLDPRLGYKYM